MSRITIDVTAEEHQKLKALAALQGQTIKDYVLNRTILSTKSDEETALEDLRMLLDDRIRKAEMNGPSDRSVDDIFAEAYRDSEAEK